MFILYSGPAHAWLKVPVELYRETQEQSPFYTSSFSYISRTHYYLEEDCDLGEFCQAYANANGYDDIQECFQDCVYVKHIEDESEIRRLSHTPKTNPELSPLYKG